MELWRAGQPAEALRHLMSASLDPELSLYASRQASLMGEFALEVLYHGLWHREAEIQKQSAIILGWIGKRDAIDALLFRMGFPDAPLEVEYALQKIGGITAPQLLAPLENTNLDNSALVDRQVSSFVRLCQTLELPVDPERVWTLIDRIEKAGADELEDEPMGHRADARLRLLLFLAERGVDGAAAPLAGSVRVGAGDANRTIAEALIALGPASLEPLEKAFHDASDGSLRILLALAHYFASGATEAAMNGPIAFVLNELSPGSAQSTDRAVEIASLAAHFSRKPNPLYSWFTNYPEPAIRQALAPDVLDPDEVRTRVELAPFFLDKTRDRDPQVAVAHLRAVSAMLPNPQVESRLDAILRSPDEPLPLREEALRIAAEHSLNPFLLPLLAQQDHPLRLRAVEALAESPDSADPEVVAAVLSILREPTPSATKRAAIEIAAQNWKRSDAGPPLLELLRSGDPLWIAAARGLAALGVAEAADPFIAQLNSPDSGASIDPEEASAIYFAMTGIPGRFVQVGANEYRFDRLALQWGPPPGKVLVMLRERSDYQGWVKVEERWEGERLFRLDEGQGELVFYDRVLFEQVERGAGVVLLEETVRQSVLSPLELTETREQKAEVLAALPAPPLAGLEEGGLLLLHQGRWVTVPLGRDLRDEEEKDNWGRSALVPLRFFDRERIRWSEKAPPAGWLRSDPQPAP
jgi:HEAT repeat protein